MSQTLSTGRLLGSLTLVSFVLLVGCWGPRHPFGTATLELRPELRQGAPLGGSPGDAGTLDQRRQVATLLQVKVALVSEAPNFRDEERVTQKRIVRNPETEALFLGTGSLSSGLKAANGQSAAEQVDALTDDVARTLAAKTVEIELTPERSAWVDADFACTNETAVTGLSVIVTRGSDGFPVSFIVEGEQGEDVEWGPAVVEGSPSEDSHSPESRLEAQGAVATPLSLSELVAFAGDAGSAPFVWSMPVAPDGPWIVGCLAIVEAVQSTIEVVGEDASEGGDLASVTGGAAISDHAEPQAASVSSDGVQLTARTVADTKQPVQEFATGWDAHRASLESLTMDATRRRAIAYLARGDDAAVALDLAVAAPDSLVTRLADCILAGARRVKAPETPGELSCWVECQALLTLSRVDDVPVAVQAVLLRELGAVGRYPSTLGELTAGMRSISGLRERINKENLFLLQDRTLSVRQRAWEWLASRDVVIPNYQPTRSASDRRRAIASYLHAEDMKAVEQKEASRD